jgi:hypothetical protein
LIVHLLAWLINMGGRMETAIVDEKVKDQKDLIQEIRALAGQSVYLFLDTFRWGLGRKIIGVIPVNANIFEPSDDAEIVACPLVFIPVDLLQMITIKKVYLCLD